MRILLTLDYEVFFGKNTGTVMRSIIDPTEALLKIAKRHHTRLVFFVDAGFILRLRSEMADSRALEKDHDAVCSQIKALAQAGHEIQLHIHPHWEDSYWTGANWNVDVRRFRLHEFPPNAIDDIVIRYTNVLRDLAGPDHAFAYRAGGWMIQPFDRLRPSLEKVGIKIDSTIFNEGISDGTSHNFDFRNAPNKSQWRFDDDPLIEVPQGHFLEVPIASTRVGPSFFWRFAWAKKMGGSQHRAFGDGKAISMLGTTGIVSRMCTPSTSVVSMDGYKACLLESSADSYRRRGFNDFVVIGHPKAFTPFSLNQLDSFLTGGVAASVCTYSSYL